MRIITDTFSVEAAPSWYFSAPYGKALESQSPGSSWLSVSDEDNGWLLPLVVEPLEGGGFHASSPYGYAGIHASPNVSSDRVTASWHSAVEVMRDLDIVSLFLRFAPFDGYSLARASELQSLDVRHISQTRLVPLADEASMWSSMLGRARTAVRKAQREGLTADISEVDPDTTFSRDAPFRQLYDATMERLDARASYRYDDEYYRWLSEGHDRMRIVTVRDADARAVASSIVLLDREIAHYHLSGSDPDGARMGANNLLIWSMMTWASSRGFTALHLGGGTSPDDSLYRFKAGFGGDALPFAIGSAILDEERYMALTYQQADKFGVPATELLSGTFFPAYRASAPNV